MKFRNETQSGPDSFNRTHSLLPSLYNVYAFVGDKETVEVPVTFALKYHLQNVTRTVYVNVTESQGTGDNVTIVQRAENITTGQVAFENMDFNGVSVDLTGYYSDWNPQKQEFFGNLVFEVWIYNSSVGGFQYHERFVDLKLNQTTTGMNDSFVG